MLARFTVLSRLKPMRTVTWSPKCASMMARA
jgi:hypothetical protein